MQTALWVVSTMMTWLMNRAGPSFPQALLSGIARRFGDSLICFGSIVWQFAKMAGRVAQVTALAAGIRYGHVSCGSMGKYTAESGL